MRRVTTFVAIVLIALGAGAAWWWTQERSADRVIVNAYLVTSTDTAFALESYPLAVHPTDPATQVADLLQGLASADVPGASHEIPTTVLPVSVVLDDGLLTVDLTQAFVAGGGSASMRGRLEQLRWSLANLPGVRTVRLLVEGEALTVMGGEGLIVQQPWSPPDDARTPTW